MSMQDSNPSQSAREINASSRINVEKPKQEVPQRMKRTITPGSASGKARGWRARVKRLSPQWGTAVMGSGIVPLLLYLLPYTATHTAFRTVGCVFLVIDMALFLGFSVMLTTRYILYPQIFSATLRHEQVSSLKSICKSCVTDSDVAFSIHWVSL